MANDNTNNNQKYYVGKNRHNNDDGTYYQIFEGTLPEGMQERIIKNNYKFDSSYFTELKNNGEYDNAIRYARAFHFNDRRQDDAFRAQLNEFENQTYYANEYNKAVGRSEYSEEIDFYNNIFNNPDALNKPNANGNLNSYGQEFTKYKEKLGSKIKNNNLYNEIEEYAEGLQLTFAPPKQTFLGIEVDNENSIDYYLKNLNVNSLEELHEKYGVGYKKYKDGSVEIKFNKSNSLSNELIYNIPSNGDKNKNILFEIGDINVKIQGYNKNGIINIDKDIQQNFSNQLIDNIHSMIDHAEGSKLDFDAEESIKEKKYIHSLFISDIDSDALTQLNRDYNLGLMTDTRFETLKKQNIEELRTAINGMGYQGEVYTNFFDSDFEGMRKSDDDNMTLHKISSNKFNEVLNYITSAQDSDITMKAGIMNGVQGMYITVNSVSFRGTQDEKERWSKNGDIKYPTVNVFLPGFASEQINYILNRDPKVQGDRIAETIKNTGSTYLMKDGGQIIYDKNRNSYIYNNNATKENYELSDDMAKKNIIASKATDIIIDNLSYNKTTIDGKINEDLEAEIMANAISCVKQIYPQDRTTFLKQDGTSFMTNELFTYDDDGNIIINNSLNKELYDKYAGPLNMALYIMNNVNNVIKNSYSDEILNTIFKTKTKKGKESNNNK